MGQVLVGDCRGLISQLDENSIDAIVTDPPYEIGFMGKSWDNTGIAYSVDLWTEVLRVLKPGGHILAFGGTRTYHRMACAIEDSGFEIRDCIQWLYGSGFPKSLNVSKAIDKAAGAEREVLPGEVVYGDGHIQRNSTKRNQSGRYNYTMRDGVDPNPVRTSPATPEAERWDGWGTALKPANEPIVLARKPLSEKTVAKNVLKWGTGALNVDGCRIQTGENLVRPSITRADNIVLGKGLGAGSQTEPLGRWPANVILDEKAGEVLGEASRFFYCAKASNKERGEGNDHPTVKPTALMRYLVRMITPPGGTVLDPFAGSGSTGIAAKAEGIEFLGCEISAEYANIARRRIDIAAPQRELFL